MGEEGSSGGGSDGGGNSSTNEMAVGESTYVMCWRYLMLYHPIRYQSTLPTSQPDCQPASLCHTPQKKEERRAERVNIPQLVTWKSF